jgi:hypothetical protein
MRSLLLLSLAAAFVLGVSVIPAGGGVPTVAQQIVITKVVEGPVPPGTEFEVEVACTDKDGPTIDETVAFPATGGTEIVTGGGASLTCTIEETVTGGATDVAYSCEPIVMAECVIPGQSFTFSSDEAEVDITFTNTFPEPEPEPAAEPLVVAPAFTG